jgi:hypothetical protein
MKRKNIMCIDSDLFGQVIVTISDVELWLEAKTQVTPDNLPNRVKAYIKNYDVASKIAAAKLSGEFYKLEKNRYGFDSDIIRSVFTKYVTPKPEEKAEQCPAYFHRCENPLCAIFQANKNKKRTYSKEKHQARKQERAAWLEQMNVTLNAA